VLRGNKAGKEKQVIAEQQDLMVKKENRVPKAQLVSRDPREFRAPKAQPVI